MITTQRISSKFSKPYIPTDSLPVNIMSWSTQEWKCFSPFILKTDGLERQKNKGGIIFENYYQGSKVFSTISSPIWDPTIPECKIVEDGNINMKKYIEWRDSLWNQPKAIRFPNKYKNIFCSLFIDQDDQISQLNYIQSRKKIYIREYIRLVRKLPQYQKLVGLIRNGQKITILEMDVPSPKKKGNYGLLCNKHGIYTPTLQNLKILINDTNEPFGHGLCLSAALLIDLEYGL
jgi:hypothetical protein